MYKNIIDTIFKGHIAEYNIEGEHNPLPYPPTLHLDKSILYWGL